MTRPIHAIRQEDAIVRMESESPRVVVLTWSNIALTVERSSDRIILVGAKKERGRGRPRKTETRFSRWIDAQKVEREVVADRLGVARNYLDKLCREEARPSLELAIAIEKLTGGSVPAGDWLRVLPRSMRRPIWAKK